MENANVYDAMLEAAAADRTVVLATVVHTRGSVPRHAGSKMVVDPERGLIGTIGGGCGEADVIEAAETVIRTGQAQVVRVELLDRVDTFDPAVCGGIMEILVEPVKREGAAGSRP